MIALLLFIASAQALGTCVFSEGIALPGAVAYNNTVLVPDTLNQCSWQPAYRCPNGEALVLCLSYNFRPLLSAYLDQTQPMKVCDEQVLCHTRNGDNYYLGKAYH